MPENPLTITAHTNSLTTHEESSQDQSEGQFSLILVDNRCPGSKDLLDMKDSSSAQRQIKKLNQIFNFYYYFHQPFLDENNKLPANQITI